MWQTQLLPEDFISGRGNNWRANCNAQVPESTPRVVVSPETRHSNRKRTRQGDESIHGETVDDGTSEARGSNANRPRPPNTKRNRRRAGATTHDDCEGPHSEQGERQGRRPKATVASLAEAMDRLTWLVEGFGNRLEVVEMEVRAIKQHLGM
jgi:hypothetical protein